MIGQHIAWGAGVTVAALSVPRMRAAGFGWCRLDPAATASRRSGKARRAAGPPGLPGSGAGSMGIYVFNAAVLMEALIENAADEGSRHSIGGDIIPMLVGGRAAHVYDFWYSQIPGVGTGDRGYWRDVGTGDSCFDAAHGLVRGTAGLHLHNSRWPILTHVPAQPPGKFVHDDGDRVGRAVSSLVS